MTAQQLVGVVGRGVFPAGHLVVTADDLGFTRGDGVFDATRVVTDGEGHSSIDHLDRHLDRFDASITGIGGELVDRRAWKATIDEALEQWTLPGEAVLKIMYSNGQESQYPLGDRLNPTEVFTITQLSEGAVRDRLGVRVAMLSRGMASNAFHQAPWLLGGVKTLAYATNVAAKREALARGADDVLYTSTDGYCLEAPTSALVCLIDGCLVTTPIEGTGILHSITQQVVFEGAEDDGFETEVRLIHTVEALDCEGAWFLSSVRGVVPILSLDERELPQHDKLTAQLRRWAGFA